MSADQAGLDAVGGRTADAEVCEAGRLARMSLEVARDRRQLLSPVERAVDHMLVSGAWTHEAVEVGEVVGKPARGFDDEHPEQAGGGPARPAPTGLRAGDRRAPRDRAG